MDLVEIYEHEKHYHLLAGWFLDYKMPVVDKEDFPRFGVVIGGLVAGFLICTDSTTCRIDNLIAKRGIDPSNKKAAFKTLLSELSGMAAEIGFRFVEVSVNSEMLKHAIAESDFVTVGDYTLFAKRLGD